MWVLLPFALFLAIALVLSVGLERAGETEAIEYDGTTVSVVVVARDEAGNLDRCIRAIRALSWPNVELILLDDDSSDETIEIMRRHADGDTKVLSTRGIRSALPGKALGLALGTETATGEWVFLTDADTAVPPDWIQHMLGARDEGVAMLTSSVVVEGAGASAAIERSLQLWLQALSVGIAGFNKQAAPLGPSMAVRRDVLSQAGGLRNLRILVADDAALWRLVRGQGYSVGLSVHPESCVRVQPVGSQRKLLQQTLRWFIGGITDAPPDVCVAAFLTQSFFLAQYSILCVGWAFDPAATAAALGLRLFADAAIVGGMRRRLGLEQRLIWIVAMQWMGVLFVSSASLYLLVRGRQLRWRGRWLTLNASRGEAPHSDERPT